MRLSELLQQVQMNYEGKNNPEVTGISISAGDVRPGFIFAALKGVRRDGVSFIPEAIQNGAAVILAEQSVEAEIPVIVVPNLRRLVSRLAAILYPSDSVLKVAVTGTNGKTSTVFYVQQLLNKLGICAASIGTIGVDSPVMHRDGSMTTPDAVTLNKTLQDLANKGVRVAALEASSHGLDQGRLEGLHFGAGAFTNLTQDHLDYHRTMEAYLQAKSLLFKEVVRSGGVAVLNADAPEFDTLKSIAEKRGERVISYGWSGADFQLIKQEPDESGQQVVFRAFGIEHTVHLNIVGDFQVMNIFAALGLCIGAGADAAALIALLPELKAPAGRIELMGTLPNGARVFVDYAHTPDALEKVLGALRETAESRGGKLICVFGAGGDRDTGKRPIMGEVASRLADACVITSDNPRTEEPASIAQAIAAGVPAERKDTVRVELDRRTAIVESICSAQDRDVILIAGKGHEDYQEIAGVRHPFDDLETAREAFNERYTRLAQKN